MLIGYARSDFGPALQRQEHDLRAAGVADVSYDLDETLASLGEGDVLLVREFTRITRDPILLADIVDRAQAVGFEIRTLSGASTNDPGIRSIVRLSRTLAGSC